MFVCGILACLPTLVLVDTELSSTRRSNCFCVDEPFPSTHQHWCNTGDSFMPVLVFPWLTYCPRVGPKLAKSWSYLAMHCPSLPKIDSILAKPWLYPEVSLAPMWHPSCPKLLNNFGRLATKDLPYFTGYHYIVIRNRLTLAIFARFFLHTKSTKKGKKYFFSITTDNNCHILMY